MSNDRYRQTQQQQHVQFPSETDADHIGVRIAELFAKLEGCDPTELPALQETVDGEALETMLANSSEERYLTVEFEYNKSIVTVTNNGRISIQPLNR